VISDLRLTVVDDSKDGKFLAICDVVWNDELVIHGVKLINANSKTFLSFPSKTAKRKCHCGGVNHFRAMYCNFCGVRFEKLPIETVDRGGKQVQAMPCPFCDDGCLNCVDGYTDKLYSEECHPLNHAVRKEATALVIKEYERSVR
jgi:DNA-binding cell septation regulator SpoVG